MARAIKGSMLVAAVAAGFVVYQTAMARGHVGLLAAAVLAVLGLVILWGAVSLRLLDTQAGEYVKGSWLALWSTVGTFVVLDPIVAALFLPRLSPPFLPDPVVHHRLVPGSRVEFRTNEYVYIQQVNAAGFRGPELGRREDVGLRILMLGDSFTMGKGVGDDETFSALVQRKLQTEFSQPVEVVNAGVDSYAPILEYLQLTRALPVLRPDVVVMNLDPGDGVQEVVYRARATFDADGRPVGVTPDAARRRSALDRLRDFALNRTFATRLFLYYVYQESGLTLQNAIAAANPAVLAHTLESDTADRSPEFEALFQSIRAAADLSARHGARFVLTIYPWGHQVSDDEWREGRRLFVPDGSRASDRSRQRIRDWAARENLDLVDTFDVFRAEARGARLYYDADMHWTPRGHLVMADALVQHLRPLLEARESPHAAR